MHYSRDEWKYFVHEYIDESKKNKMEEHMTECEHCMNIYLEYINDKKLMCNNLLSNDFTDNVMEKVLEIDEISKNRRKNKNVILYYAVASLITILLTFSGVFQFVSDKVYVSKDVDTENISKVIENSKNTLSDMKSDYIEKFKIDNMFE